MSGENFYENYKTISWMFRIAYFYGYKYDKSNKLVNSQIPLCTQINLTAKNRTLRRYRLLNCVFLPLSMALISGPSSAIIASNYNYTKITTFGPCYGPRPSEYAAFFWRFSSKKWSFRLSHRGVSRTTALNTGNESISCDAGAPNHPRQHP